MGEDRTIFCYNLSTKQQLGTKLHCQVQNIAFSRTVGPHYCFYTNYKVAAGPNATFILEDHTKIVPPHFILH